MYKKVISISLVAMAAMFSGCGNSDTTCRIDVQKAIDEGRYDDAIADMNGSCKNAFDASDLNMNLASAYMGKSGYSVSDISDMLINNNGDNGDAFSSFISDTNAKKTDNSLPLLTKAKSYYVQAIGGNEGVCTDDNLSAINNSRWTNACLYIGFNETVKTAATVSHLTNNVSGVVDAINSDSATPYDMNASMDALSWVTDENFSKNDTNITASPITINGNSYANIIVEYNNTTSSKTFYRLAKSSVRETNNTTLITDGYCDTDGNKSKCADINNSDGSINLSKQNSQNCYACPVMLDANTSLSVTDSLVDALNNGTDTISAVSNDPDITQSINDFKQNIIDSRKNKDDKNTTITVQDITNYLQQ